VSWAAIEACNCSSTAIDCVEPKFFCTLPTAANAGTSAPSAQLPARFEPPRTCADGTPVLPLVLTAFRLSADTLEPWWKW
jgi:hypothetical protein